MAANAKGPQIAPHAAQRIGLRAPRATAKTKERHSRGDVHHFSPIPLTIVCEPCGRRGRYKVERLVAKHGNAKVLYL
jgi:hypothetical protein